MKRIVAVISLFMFLLAQVSFAQGTPMPLPSTPSPTSSDVRELLWPEDSAVVGSQEEIVIGTSKVFRFDRSIVRASVSDPNICDIVPINRQEILVNSREAGRMNLIVWDDKDNVATYPIQSTRDANRLEKLIKRIDPASEVEIIPFNDTMAVYGQVDTAQKLEQMQEITASYDENALNFMRIKEPKQVLLEVRFIEIDRTDSLERGIDFETFGDFLSTRFIAGQTGLTNLAGTGSFTGASYAATDVLPVGNQSIGNFIFTYFGDNYALNGAIEYLETKNLLKIIARPNLVARDGEEATFMVGGEFAVPISNDGDISVDYREYGTMLTFTPEVIENELIRLSVQTEISELVFTNTVTISSTTVPSLLSREQSTVAQLNNGHSLVISGMITQRVRRINKKVPILGDIPVLDEIFSNESYSRTDVELIVVITPHIVKPFKMKSDENKVFYDPEKVEKAVRIIRPAYSDPHADAIDHMVVQNEDYGYLDKYDQHETMSDRQPTTGLFRLNMPLEEKKIAQPEIYYDRLAEQREVSLAKANLPKSQPKSQPLIVPANKAKKQAAKGAPVTSDKKASPQKTDKKTIKKSSGDNHGVFVGGIQ